MTSITELIKTGDFHGLRKALDDDPSLASAPVPEAPSPILLAAYYGKTDIAHLLRERKVDLDIQEAAALGDLHELERLATTAEVVRETSADGFFPLGYAAYFGHIDAVRLLLARGADLEQVSKNPLGVTALHAALSNGHKEIARVLLEAGADVDAVQGGELWTPLHYCAYSGDRETAERILERHPKLDLQDKEGRIPADLADERGFTDLAEMLRPKGA